MITSAEMLLSEIRSELNAVNNELKRMPRGALMISTNGKARITYFQVRWLSGKRIMKAVGRDLQTMKKLARKAFLLEYRRRLDQTEQELTGSLAAMPDLSFEAVCRALPRHFELLPGEWLCGKHEAAALKPVFDGSIAPQPLMLSYDGDAKEWAESPYRANTKAPENLVHRAAGGFMTRSKSEAAIAAIYLVLGIPFHFDEVFSTWKGQVSPDFTGIRRDGAVIYHEHWGRSDESYIRDNRYKLELYMSSGIIPGRNLLLTFDDAAGGIDLSLIRQQICWIYGLK
ncbi:MAG: hypothetical protein IJJ75_03940 [Firmicutes bacterium]|nr:hypothetical protein [Bacillota bacterium]